ncbi:sigma factor-like helix-turn-helix DNA-binding protein [Inquilinus sp. NPDC058860]|uniref:sigma factor-like helix-turn-helix DNA-binding protein n=1 Tax=Inquilinus sp. NPDC058860 TaxID=3346652 RepID=UPI0036C635C0
MTTLRAFLMLRAPTGEWAVSVHRDLKTLLEAWASRDNAELATGVLHVGFDRPPSRAFDDLVCNRSGRLLLTGAAKYALPSGFLSTDLPIGFIEGMPVYLGRQGWGYVLDDEEVQPPSPQQPTQEAEGWVRDFLEVTPEAAAELESVGIFDELSYWSRETELDRRLRTSIGVYRFEEFIGSGRADPCEFARAAPPWLADRPFESLELTVRISNVFSGLKITRIRDLETFTLKQLLDVPNFGRRSVSDLVESLEHALAEGPFSIDDRVSDASESSLLVSVRQSLTKYEEREREVLRRRMGLDTPAQTLQQIGEVYGVTRERVRQIESKILKRLLREEFWDDLLSKKLMSLLQNREVPLPLLGVEAADAWFTGISQFPETFRYILSNICKGSAEIVAVDGVEYLAFLSQARWEGSIGEASRLLQSGVGESWSQPHCRALVDALLPRGAREFKDLLWEKSSRYCHFVVDERGDLILRSYGRGAEHVVEAVLQAANHPLHFTEIAELASARAGRDIDVRRAHNAAAAVGFLLGRGTYGVDRHLRLGNGDVERLGDEAEDVVAGGSPGRQWHASEILNALIERSSGLALRTDKYVIDVALQRSGGLRRLGRMVWAQPNPDDGAVARANLRQAIIAVVQQSGRPLRTSEIKQRLVALRGVNEIFQVVAADPLLRIGPGLWGLNDRDIAVKRDDQPHLLNHLSEILSMRGVAFHVSEILDALEGRVPPEMTAEMVCSLAAVDPRMRVNSAQYLFLEDWGGPRRMSVSDAVTAILIGANVPLSLDDIVADVEKTILRPCERSTVSNCLRALGATFDAESARWSRGVSPDEDVEDEDAFAA